MRAIGMVEGRFLSVAFTMRAMCAHHQRQEGEPS